MELTEGAKKALRDLEQHQRFWFILAKMEVTKSENSYTIKKYGHVWIEK